MPFKLGINFNVASKGIANEVMHIEGIHENRKAEKHQTAHHSLKQTMVTQPQRGGYVGAQAKIKKQKVLQVMHQLSLQSETVWGRKWNAEHDKNGEKLEQYQIKFDQDGKRLDDQKKKNKRNDSSSEESSSDAEAADNRLTPSKRQDTAQSPELQDPRRKGSSLVRSKIGEGSQVSKDPLMSGDSPTMRNTSVKKPVTKKMSIVEN